MSPARPKSVKTPYYKLDKEYEPQTVPTFQSRRTLANHVRDNMLCCGRRSYYQRIIYIAKHKKPIEVHRIKDPFMNIIKEVYKAVPDERFGGLMLGHDKYTLHMLEGSDDLIGKYCTLLTKLGAEIFEKSKVVLVYNNVNQVCCCSEISNARNNFQFDLRFSSVRSPGAWPTCPKCR